MQLFSTITCPACVYRASENMPTDACVFFHVCMGCGARLKPKEGGFVFTPNWFGCYAWDPLKNILYASSMGNPVYKLEL